jgi:hypothetical protein
VETLFFGDPNGAALFALVVSGFGGLVAAIAYVVLARSRRGAAIATAAAIVVFFVAVSYWLYLTPFYAVELEAGELRLRSYYPSRAVTLARGEIARFERRNEVSKNDYLVNLVVHTKDGRTYTSGNTRPQQLAEEYARLQTWLEQP